MFYRALALVLAVFVLTPPADAEQVRSKTRGHSDGPFSVLHDPDRPRSDVGMPLLSFLLPGFDQWWEGQYGHATAYTGVAIGGLVYAANVASANGLSEDDDDEDESDENEEPSIDMKDVTVRKVMLGQLAYQGAGGMSAYHAFRSAVRTRRAKGEYRFLTKEETPADVLLAPFEFRFLRRSTTYIPLGIGLGLATLIYSSPGEDVERSSFTGADAFFTSAFSFNAGTHEEAVFRGWIMPVMMDSWGSEFWANALSSLLFAAAHLPTNPTPIPQLLLGYHLGNVTIERDWTIAEAVFIHTWWDIIAFATVFSFQQKDDNPSRIPPVLWLPPFEWRF